MAEILKSRHVKVSIGGEPIGAVDVDYSFINDEEEDDTPIFVPNDYEASVTMDLDAGAMDKILDALIPRERGATKPTLMRRVQYGGRKGRGALQRLFASGVDVHYETFAGSWRGKAVFFPDGTVRMKVRLIRRNTFFASWAHPWGSQPVTPEELVERLRDAIMSE